MRRLLPIVFICAAMPFNSVKSQQIEPGETNYYLVSVVLAGGAVASYSIYRNIPSCPASAYDALQPVAPQPGAPPPDTNCNARETLKTAVAIISIGCAVGAIWSLVHAVRGDKLESRALLNVSAGKRGALRVPDVAYRAPRRDVSVLLLHAAF